MKSCLILLILTIAAVGAGCSGAAESTSEPTPTPADPTTHAAQQEKFFQIHRDISGEARTEARHAVAEFVKANLPEWNIKGMSCQASETNVFSIDADLNKQDRHVVVTFDTRKFFAESGDSYWIAIPVNKFRFDRLRKLSDADLLKKLQESESELEDLRSASESNSDSDPP